MEDKETGIALDLASLRSQYRSGTVTVSRVAALVLSRIHASRDDHVWIALADDTTILRRAAELDALLQADPAILNQMPLFGAPFAVKDNIDVAGIPTTAACDAFAYTPERDAPVVTHLLDAGAIFVGKTNMDQFATGLVGTRSPYGTPVNPFDANYIPGGSSSGSAVAVAKGYASFSLGTDTAGSGRVPAGYNNVVGLKPTCGRLSTTGVVAACRSLDCVSILALSCHDAAAVERVTEGFDAEDPFSRRPVPAAVDEPSDKPVILAIPREDQLRFFGDEASRQAFHATCRTLVAKGFELKEIDFTPFERAGRLLYEGPWVAERQIAFGEELQRYANAVDSKVRAAVEDVPGYTAADQFRAYYSLKTLKRQAENVLSGLSALLVPTMSRIYTIDEAHTATPSASRNLGYYTNFVNLLDLAAVAVPAGTVNGSLPFGVTLVAPAYGETRLLAIGDRIHRATSATVGALGTPLPAAKPETAPASAGRIRICVVGAHMRGLPLNRQLVQLGGRFVEQTTTAAGYRLYLLDWLDPMRPGMVRDTDGVAIEVELWDLPASRFGDFFVQVAPPLSFGTVELVDGSKVAGFLCEAYAIQEARDISNLGGWRAYLES
jgi:allophanate hydrolase